MLSKFSLATCAVLLSSSFAFASTAIGTAMASGEIRVDGYVVRGNASLFDGSAVETSRATATLRLTNGAQIKLAPDSLGALYRDHLVLQRGKIELAAPDTFRLEAAGLHVSSTGPGAHGVIAMSAGNSVQVAAMSGRLEVRDGDGILLARIDPGNAESFTPQPESSGTVTIVGALLKSGGRFFVKQKDGTLIQALGVNLDQYVGKELTITGTILTGATPSGGATTVISVVQVGPAPNGGLGASHTKVIWIVAAGATIAAVPIIILETKGASR